MKQVFHKRHQLPHLQRTLIDHLTGNKINRQCCNIHQKKKQRFRRTHQCEQLFGLICKRLILFPETFCLTGIIIKRTDHPDSCQILSENTIQAI